MWQNSYDGKPCVYIVPTPIGNLEDITFRALNILRNVSAIFCEDTRVTIQLLNYYKIKNKLIHLDDHNEEEVKNRVMSYLSDGLSVAIVTDRGTPIISDPGYKTVKFIKENNYNVIALPGACAFVPALVASSISSEHFLFYGFLSNKEMKMKEELYNLKDCPYTLVFYEAPHRILRTLNNILDIFGDRYISISREISKLHESIFTGSVNSAIESLTDIKGEFVLVVSGNCNLMQENTSIIDEIESYINSGLSSMDAIKIVSKERNIPKNVVYKEFIERYKK